MSHLAEDVRSVTKCTIWPIGLTKTHHIRSSWIGYGMAIYRSLSRKLAVQCVLSDNEWPPAEWQIVSLTSNSGFLSGWLDSVLKVRETELKIVIDTGGWDTWNGWLFFRQV